MATLEQLEGRRFPPVEGETTYLVGRCTELMTTMDIDAFTVEDLRILLGQQLGVFHLLPRAVAVLLDDPLAEGDFYPGDLLTAVMRLTADHWHAYPSHRTALVERVAGVRREDVAAALADAIRVFVGAQ
ncbi:MAG: hypothetical protein HY830_13025 [Actinobacteria bacterium]|nr:hypothetical protein [Actinomycetota bacterium]